MRIVGEWFPCDDGITRPVVLVGAVGADGGSYRARSLIDSGADCTVLSAAFLRALALPPQPPTPGLRLQGVSGNSPFVEVATALEFTRDDGGTVRVRGQFAAFTDPAATDLSVLGRDVLDHFDVILSRRRNQVLLLAPNHQYHVTPP